MEKSDAILSHPWTVRSRRTLLEVKESTSDEDSPAMAVLNVKSGPPEFGGLLGPDFATDNGEPADDEHKRWAEKVWPFEVKTELEGAKGVLSKCSGELA